MKKRNKKNIHNIRLIILALGVIIFIIAILALFFTLELPYSYMVPKNISISENTVVNVIDGDTFTLFSGDKVRLLCIDTPEVGQDKYEEAKNFLNDLILGKEVILKNGNDDMDKYGRLLRYVYVSEPAGNVIFVNREMLLNNYTGIFNYGNETDFVDKLK